MNDNGPIRIPGLGIGGAPFGNLFEAVSDVEVAATIDAAWDTGVRFFDTAPHYGLGLSERRLGTALMSRPREEVVVSTKVGRLLDRADGGGARDDEGFDVPASWRRRRDYSRDGIRRSVEESLIRTGLDRFDVLFLHDPDEHWTSASTTGIDALVELREEGTVRAIGVGMNQSSMLTRFVEETDVDLVMIAGRYTLLDRTAERDLLPAALERGVGVIAAGVYNSGLLSRPQVASDTTFDYAAAPSPLVDRARRIAAVCQRYGVTLPAAAVAFPQRHPAVRSVVVGVRSPEQLVETVERMAVAVPPELWAELEDSALLR